MTGADVGRTVAKVLGKTFGAMKVVSVGIGDVFGKLSEMFENFGGEKNWKMCRKNREVFGCRWLLAFCND